MNRYCVTLVCNFKYLDKAGFVAAQLLAQSNRDFDVVICSDVVPEERPGFLPEGAILRQLDVGETLQNLPQNERLKDYAYWRVPAIEQLSSDYERILYLDTDVFVSQDGISEVFQTEMQGCTLAAVLDVHQRHRPNRPLREFSVMGYPTAPYFNSGVLLIDCSRWIALSEFKRIMELAEASPEALFCHDQSLLNLHFYMNWLELSPLWNWQNSDRVNLIGEFVSPYLVHFLGPRKVWNTDDIGIPRKFRAAYSSYLGESFSDEQSTSGLFKLLLKNAWYLKRTLRYLSSFPTSRSTIRHRDKSI
ncbi:hypothetical protein OAL91_00920 [bacterium]|nr:hypothetical protein [bacterium]